MDLNETHAADELDEALDAAETVMSLDEDMAQNDGNDAAAETADAGEAAEAEGGDAPMTVADDELVWILQAVLGRCQNPEAAAARALAALAEDDAAAPVADAAKPATFGIMVRGDHGLIEGSVERDTLYTTLPAGTPILRNPVDTYTSSLDWLKAEGLVEDDDGCLRLLQPVKFVTPGAALSMTIGGGKTWVDEDERKIDFSTFGVARVREFVKTGLKVRT